MHNHRCARLSFPLVCFCVSALHARVLFSLVCVFYTPQVPQLLIYTRKSYDDIQTNHIITCARRQRGLKENKFLVQFRLIKLKCNFLFRSKLQVHISIFIKSCPLGTTGWILKSKRDRAVLTSCDWRGATKAPATKIHTTGCLRVASSQCAKLAAFFNCSVTILGLWCEFLNLKHTKKL